VLNRQERWAQFQIDPAQEFEDGIGPAKERSLDWSEPRPEFGHTNVALAFFGPRWLTKDLDLERRSFLISYDPESDPTGEHLSYCLLSALPVCANINMDYHTSSAFPEAMGAGSKLPLNIASGLALMTGASSDLRIGLATQAIDRHQPLRLLAFVYSEEESFQNAIAQSPRLRRLIENDWIHLIRIDPKSHEIEVLTKELRSELSRSF
jgi:uncharacterized protein YbcC (UPF0753/DUF2309 family)